MLLWLHENAEIDMLRYICAGYERAVSHFRCVDSYSCPRTFSENTNFHWKIPVVQKLDFEKIFQVKPILCSVSQFEVKFLMTQELKVSQSFYGQGTPVVIKAAPT